MSFNFCPPLGVEVNVTFAKCSLKKCFLLTKLTYHDFLVSTETHPHQGNGSSGDCYPVSSLLSRSPQSKYIVQDERSTFEMSAVESVYGGQITY